MGRRKTPFVPREHYHIYNRGVDKRNIVSSEKDMDRFFQSMEEFNTIEPIGSIYENSFVKKEQLVGLGGLASKSLKVKDTGKKLVEFITYCVNPNHFHFILRQVAENGIKKFMHRLATGYTMYFNEKEKRSGSLFQGRFKAIHINSNEYILHLSAYVNLNDRVHKLAGFGGSTSKSIELVRSRSSWREYVGGTEYGGYKKDGKNFCKKDIILGQFRNRKEYEEFAKSSLEGILERRAELKGLSDFLLE